MHIVLNVIKTWIKREKMTTADLEQTVLYTWLIFWPRAQLSVVVSYEFIVLLYYLFPGKDVVCCCAG